VHVLRRLLYVGAAVIVIGLALVGYSRYTSSLAVVRGGVAPGFAAADMDAFDAVSNPTETSPSLSWLQMHGQVFVIPAETRCRVIQRLWTVQCQGIYHPYQVKVLDGSRRGETAWMCSDALRMMYPWP